MKKYAKLISETIIELAPQTKNGIVNYNSENNEAMLFRDNYRILELTEHETSNIGSYISVYEMKNDKIIQKWVFIPFTKQEMESLRADLYLKEIDPITAQIQRLRDEDPSSPKIEELLLKRANRVQEIKTQYPDPEENISEPEVENNE